MKKPQDTLSLSEGQARYILIDPARHLPWHRGPGRRAVGTWRHRGEHYDGARPDHCAASRRGEHLGFIFARAARPADAETALRIAHRRLYFDIRAEYPATEAPAAERT